MKGKRNDIQLMLAKAHDKLETARINFSNGKYDDTVSRCYYAVYHAMNAALISKGFSFSSHAHTIGVFNREFVKTGVFPKYFSEIIQGLFEDRQSGDYDFDSWIDEPTVRESIENAATIVTGIAQFLEGEEHMAVKRTKGV